MTTNQKTDVPPCTLNYLSEKKIDGYREDFKEFDGDANGKINLEEFLKMMLREEEELVNDTQSELDAHAKRRKKDLQENKTLNLEDFKKKLKDKNALEYNNFLSKEISHYDKQFKSYDSDADGLISLTEFLLALENVEIEKILDDMDIDHSKDISKNEMSQMMIDVQNRRKAAADKKEKEEETAKRKEAVNKFFDKIDTDKNGRISVAEFINFMRKQAEDQCIEHQSKSPVIVTPEKVTEPEATEPK